MDKKTIQRLRRQLQELRGRGGVRAAELERLARGLARKRHRRGKEPTWISTLLPHARPVSIPRHSGDLNRFTARAILDQLESDIDALEEAFKQERS